MWDLKSFRIYTLCSQEKSYVFSIWDNFFLNILLNFIIYNMYNLYSHDFFFLIFHMKY
jgi:hypothetical protein